MAAAYDAGSIFSNGFVLLVRNGKRGYLDAQGNIAVPLAYEDTATFKDGLVRVKKRGIQLR